MPAQRSRSSSASSGSSKTSTSTTKPKDGDLFSPVRDGPYWPVENVPPVDDEEFIKFISASAVDGEALNPQPWDPPKSHCKQWETHTDPHGTTSFGDNGLTAIVNGYGDLMHFGHFKGLGKTGMFVVDHLTVDEPWHLASRWEQMQTIIGDRKQEKMTYGLNFPERQLNWPEQSFVHYRWPRFHYESGRVKATVQWVVRGDTLLQQYRITNKGEEEIDVPFSFKNEMLIRDIDYLEPEDLHHFNKKDAKRTRYGYTRGPNGHSWVFTHHIPRNYGSDEGQTPFLPTQTGDAESLWRPDSQRSISEIESFISTPTVSTAQSFRLGRRRGTGKISLGPDNLTSPTGSGRPLPWQDEEAALEHQPSRPVSISDQHKKTASEAEPDGNQNKDAANEDQNQEDDKMDEKNIDLDSLAVVVAIILNGETLHWPEAPEQWPKEPEPALWSHKLPGAPKAEADGDAGPAGNEAHGGNQNSMEIVVAYRLEHVVKSETDWQKFIIPVSDTRVDQFLEQEASLFADISIIDNGPSSPPANSEDSKGHEDPAKAEDTLKPPNWESCDFVLTHMEFGLRRQLEHILSTCSIPMEIDATSDIDLPHIKPIALTCGDRALHRIIPSASYFAFMFLIECATRIHQSLPCTETGGPLTRRDAFATSLMNKIFLVCEGHLRWLHEVAQEPKHTPFATNYWPTGKMMDIPGSAAWLPMAFISDDAFQLIKVCEFLKLTELVKPEESRLIKERWSKAFQARSSKWTDCLRRADFRNACAWGRDGTVNSFRLEDHAWVWTALKSREKLEVSKTDNQQRSQGTKIMNDRVVVKDPSLVQRQILQRFSIENEALRQRMFAVGRSARETRFLLHARDTALFYAADLGFFNPHNAYQELWEQTLRAQPFHQENEDAYWSKLLRYALAIMMAVRGHSINKKTPRDMIKTSLEVLYGCASPSGIFAAFTTIFKEPDSWINEGRRDAYFHAQFEIQYILLTHTTGIREALDKPSVKGAQTASTNADPVRPKPQDLGLIVDDTIFRPTEQIQSPDRHRPNAGFTRIDLGSRTLGPPTTMKKSIPFNTRIDTSSIVEIGDEWLYRYPSFVRGRPAVAPEEFLNICVSIQDSHEKNDEYPPQVVAVGASQWVAELKPEATPAADHPARSPSPFPDPEQPMEDLMLVIDVPKSKRTGGRQKGVYSSGPMLLVSTASAKELLNRRRMARNAKKRFVWLPMATPKQALACYIGSPDDYRLELRVFFERHSRHEQQFFEEADLLTNTWDSELHISFYQLSGHKADVIKGLPELVYDSLPGSSDLKITKAMISFRFDGDFFDRYWTCHLVEFIPRFGLYLQHYYPLDRVRDNEDWRQRKILELLLFHSILIEVVASTQNIYMRIREQLGVRRGALPTFILNSDDYFSSSAQWQKFQQLLQAVEEELASTMTVIARWEVREKERGQERPRWTRNDERKYRGAITKLEAETSAKIRELRSCNNSIKSLKEMLIHSQDQIRDDLSLRGSENIRFFTYVTVIFLPLGFAASVFSMSDAPPSRVIKAMAITAIATLMITVFALVNAKSVLGVAEQGSFLFSRYSRAKIRKSHMMQAKEQNKKRREELWENVGRNTDDKEQERRRLKSPKVDNSWHFSFWLMYIFLEKPADLVVKGFNAMSDPKEQKRAVIPILTSFAAFPIFVLSWCIHLVLCNVFDAAWILFCWFRWVLSSEPVDEESKERLDLKKLVTSTNRFRPLLPKGFDSYDDSEEDEDAGQEEARENMSQKSSQAHRHVNGNSRANTMGSHQSQK